MQPPCRIQPDQGVQLVPEHDGRDHTHGQNNTRVQPLRRDHILAMHTRSDAALSSALKCHRVFALYEHGARRHRPACGRQIYRTAHNIQRPLFDLFIDPAHIIAQ